MCCRRSRCAIVRRSISWLAKSLITPWLTTPKGKPLEDIPGISFLKNGEVVHNPDAPQIQDLDALPHVTDIYKRDLDVTRYNVPFLLNPYVSLYTTRGCPAQCTFCLWPQTLSGHPWRKRSTDDVAAEMAKVKQYWPEVKEFFFDDDTFNIQKARTIELCAKLKPLGLTWSCTSRVTTDLRNPESHEGSRLPAAHRRVTNPAISRF